MITAPAWYCRPAARHWRAPAPQIAETQIAETRAGAPAFHAELPGYRPTELTELPALAEELGVGRVFVKDESTRMGLGAFKVLGASWAVARLLTDPGDAGRVSLGELRRAAAAHPVELVTATDGNHGRAVAWMARLLGLEARVFVPLAWPVLAGGLDAAIAVPDHLATEAGADLGRLGVRSGPSRAASLAGVRAALTGPGSGARRAGLGVTGSSVVLLLSTEGTEGK